MALVFLVSVWHNTCMARLKIRREPIKINLRLERALLDKLREMALKNDRSLNSEVEYRLLQSFTVK